MIRVGPAGWSYPDWEGRVYPRFKPKGFHPLRHLAPMVDCVEVNASFYAMPRAEHAARWASFVEERTGFRFVVQLHRDFTHEAPPEREEVWADKMCAWRAGVEPLRRRGFLAAVLVQFPASFHQTPRNVLHLRRVADLLDGLPRVLEVRNRSWFEPPSLAMVAGLGFSLAHQDLPPSWDHPPLRFRPTGPLGYLRLHGRNERDWFRASASSDERHNYLYSPPEVGELAQRAGEIAAESDETFVVTNNHSGGQALANAVELRWLLGGRRPVSVGPELVGSFPHLAPLSRAGERGGPRGQEG